MMGKPNLDAIRDKRVLLAGAAGGIGQSIARRLSLAGARILLVDLNHSALKALSDRLHQPCFAADLRRHEERMRLADRVEQLWGALDGLVNCAGINAFGLQDAVTDLQIESVIAVNLTMPVLLTRQLLPLLECGSAPVIVNLGSVFGHIGFPGFAAYNLGIERSSESIVRSSSWHA